MDFYKKLPRCYVSADYGWCSNMLGLWDTVCLCCQPSRPCGVSDASLNDVVDDQTDVNGS
jgi:hypothetical protein